MNWINKVAIVQHIIVKIKGEVFPEREKWSFSHVYIDKKG